MIEIILDPLLHCHINNIQHGHIHLFIDEINLNNIKHRHVQIHI